MAPPLGSMCAIAKTDKKFYMRLLGIHSLLSFLFFLALSGNAQSRTLVLDSATGKGLPYATIACVAKNWVVMTDSLGAAQVPDNLRGAVLECSFVGFRTRRVTFYEGGNLLLSQKPMPEAVVRGCKPTVPLFVDRAGSLKRSETIRFVNWLTGAEMAVWVPNTSGKAGWIQGVGFGIKRFSENNKRYSGNPNTPVRLRFYRRGADGAPEDELSNEDVRVAGKNFGWFEPALDSFRIPFPEDGVFVVFELIVSGDAYLWKVPFDGPPSPKAITELYGYSFAAHPVSEKKMYFRNPMDKAWRFMAMGRQALELDVQLSAMVCR
jgi:hypothetical protein